MNTKGAILITSIFIVLLIATLGIGYLSLVNNQLEMADVSVKSAKAFYTAESGISEAVLFLKNSNDWSNLAGVLLSGELDHGSYSVEVDPETVPSVNTITIKSTGKLLNFQRIIKVELDRETYPNIITKKNWREI